MDKDSNQVIQKFVQSNTLEVEQNSMAQAELAIIREHLLTQLPKPETHEDEKVPHGNSLDPVHFAALLATDVFFEERGFKQRINKLANIWLPNSRGEVREVCFNQSRGVIKSHLCPEKLIQHPDRTEIEQFRDLFKTRLWADFNNGMELDEIKHDRNGEVGFCYGKTYRLTQDGKVKTILVGIDIDAPEGTKMPKCSQVRKQLSPPKIIPAPLTPKKAVTDIS